TSSLGALWTYVYDDAGNVIESTAKDAKKEKEKQQAQAAAASGATVSAAPPGKVPQQSDPLFHATYRYDAYDNLVYRAVDTLAGATEESKWFYSDLLRLVKTESPNGGETKYDYDKANRVVLVVDPLLNETRNHYNGAGNVDSVKQTVEQQVYDPGSGA